MTSNRARSFSTYIGVDLGGGKGKNTAVALLEEYAEGVRVCYVGTKNEEGKPFYDNELLSLLRPYAKDALLAVDAPLISTVCMRCRLPTCPGEAQCIDPVVKWFHRKCSEGVARGKGGTRKPFVTPYTQRACEIYLRTVHDIFPRETLGQGMGPLTARAHYLRRALGDPFVLNQNLIEVYPKATLQMLFGLETARRYKRFVDTWKTRARILEKLSDRLYFAVWREGCLSNDHCFDAVICAYTGYLWAKEGWQMPEADGEIFDQDGWIWIPPDPKLGV